MHNRPGIMSMILIALLLVLLAGCSVARLVIDEARCGGSHTCR